MASTRQCWVGLTQDINCTQTATVRSPVPGSIVKSSQIQSSKKLSSILTYPLLFKGQVMLMPPFMDKVIYLSLAKGPARKVNSLYWAHSSSGCSFNFQKFQHDLLWVALCLLLLSSSPSSPQSNLNSPVQLPDRRFVPPC